MSVRSALRLPLALIATVLLPCFAHADPSNPYLHPVDATGHLRLELTERTGHSHFWWPRTLLHYRVVFAEDPGAPDRWRLTNQTTGRPTPFQLSEVHALADGRWVGILSFFSDLPTGASRSHDFHVAGPGEAAAAARSDVRVTESDGALTIDNGALRVRLPSSRELTAAETAPGPILAIADAKGWMGRSALLSPKKAVERITTDVLERGPLFARVRVSYGFAGGGSYAVTVTAPLGSEFVEIGEQMNGLEPADNARFEFTWTDAAFTRRRGDEPIDRPHVLPYRGEDPHFAGPAGVEHPEQGFYFRLGHSAADNTVNVTNVDFMDRDQTRAVGLAVRDGNRWDDGSYAIWASSDNLAIRFRLENGTLVWTWPLTAGTRDTLLAAYNPATVAAALGDAFRRWQQEGSPMAEANTGVPAAKSYVAFLNSRQGGMSLDVVKEWQLAYSDAARRPDSIELPDSGAKPLASLDAYLHALWTDNELLRPEGNWLSPVGLRVFSGWVVPGYLRWRDQMPVAERHRVEALLLFHAYFASREEVSPMRPMLKGHPNFMADWKYPLMAGAFLFPEHPLANEWADRFEKLIELLGVFYVRPAVPAWDAKGGRWTENIGVYNWAFIEPVMHANQLGLRFDGRDRWPSAGLALHGEYLAGILTPPVKIGRDGVPLEIPSATPLDVTHGFERIYPPQGAHSGRRSIPAALEDVAESFQRYRPLLAEQLRFATRRPAGHAVNTDAIPLPKRTEPKDRGIAPELASAKYTGYGIVLRAAAGTPDEIAVYLQQIDKGPNYRWGFGNEGGCGDIYYYAGGRSYAGHLMEDAGDRRVTDAEVTSNTGVYKGGTFRGIGMNELTAPFHDLEVAQFADLLPREGPEAYAWPEYRSRSVLLVGHDYILVLDAADATSRFAWNTVVGQDAKPTLIPLRGETSYRTTQTSAGPRGERSESERFESYKTPGDRLTLVSHRHDLQATQQKGALTALTQVRTPESNDTIIDQRDPVHIATADLVFDGRAGVVRQHRDGVTELALFHGTRIGTNRLTLAVDRPDLAVSARDTKAGEISGMSSSRTAGTLTLRLPEGEGVGARFYVDGAPVAVRREAGNVIVALPGGRHHWQFTAGLPQPSPSRILRTVATADGAIVSAVPSAGATQYRFERSDDDGASWTPLGAVERPELVLTGIKPPAKVLVRVVALNRDNESAPATPYPVYVTGRPAESPAGLRVKLDTDRVTASWGEILGAREYVLSRRRAGTTTWSEVYRGTETSVIDPAPGVVAPMAVPGLEAEAARDAAPAPMLYEYTVQAVDAVGTSERSSIADTNPSRWRNWYPPVPLRFKRQSAYWLPPYVSPAEVPPPYYPE